MYSRSANCEGKATASWQRRRCGLARWIASSVMLATFLLTSSGLLLAQPAGPSPIPSIFDPHSTPAHDIYHLSLFVLSICATIFLVVFSLIVYAAFKYRHRPSDDDCEPPQIYGSNQVELDWTVIPILIVVVLFLASARVIHAVEDAQFPPDAIQVTATGHQFWWEFEYPKYGFVTANELHVPVSPIGTSLPTHIMLLSADTDHSFWVPQLAGKTDLIPNRRNEMWVEPQEDFDRWVQDQKSPAVVSAQVADGRKVFETNACMSCHTIAGTPANGRFGPDVTHLMSRGTIA